VITFHLKTGDAVTLPDGAQWFITQDDSHKFWLSDKPDLGKSRDKMAVSGHAKKAPASRTGEAGA
jgi:hypothetical protein